MSFKVFNWFGEKTFVKCSLLINPVCPPTHRETKRSIYSLIVPYQCIKPFSSLPEEQGQRNHPGSSSSELWNLSPNMKTDPIITNSLHSTHFLWTILQTPHSLYSAIQIYLQWGKWTKFFSDKNNMGKKQLSSKLSALGLYYMDYC